MVKSRWKVTSLILKSGIGVAAQGLCDVLRCQEPSCLTMCSAHVQGYLIVQDGCWNSSHYINRKKKDEKKERMLLARTLPENNTLLLFTLHWSRLSHMITLAAAEAGKCSLDFVWFFWCWELNLNWLMLRTGPTTKLHSQL